MKVSKSLFRKFNLATIIAVYILILVGGIVRSVGAGMGCPDWPKCFGEYIPPTNAEQLPDNYKEYFLEKRLAKNERLSSILESMGFIGLANSIQSDPKVKGEEDFSVVKAWTEYINRLIGAVIGLFILLNVALSFSYWKLNRTVTFLAIFSLILVLFQGWIGSLVVSTNLLPGFISFHMGLALLLVGVLINIQYKVSKQEIKPSLDKKGFYVGLFLLFIPHLFMGTQVRESIDLFVFEGVSREFWISRLDWVFYFHRSFSLVLLALAIYLAYDLFKKNQLMSSQKGGFLLLALVLMGIEIVGGAIMAYFEVPAFIQPIHLFAGSVLFGVLYYLILLSNNSVVTTNERS